MPIHVYSEDCSGCLPVAMDGITGQVLPDDHPLMLRMARAWAKTTRAQRIAWHNVTCQNSRDPHDLKLARKFIRSIQDS